MLPPQLHDHVVKVMKLSAVVQVLNLTPFALNRTFINCTIEDCQNMSMFIILNR